MTKEYMYKTGETVVYRKQGIYEITEIREQKIGSEMKEYYVLSSVYDKNSTVYVPVESQALVLQMEKVLSKEEIHSIIDKSEEIDLEWIENNTQRALFFDEIIKSDDLAKILALMKLFMIRKDNAEKKYARSYARDEKAFAFAQRVVTEAFAYPLGLSKTEVVPYIISRINK